MAATGGEGSKKIPEHPLLAKLRGDPAQTQESTVRLMGYVGRATRQGCVRLYPSLDDLSQYIDVQESDIVHVEQVPESVMEHGGSSLWVKQSAELVHSRTETTTVQAQFLGGGIAATNLHEAPDAVTAASPLITQQTLCQACISIALRTCYQVTCGATCLLRTCYRTCAGTCVGTCFLTCYNTCLRTCAGVTCGRTCQFVTCYATCMVFTCYRTCFKTCICPIEQNPFDPFGGGGGPFGGGGDPFGGGGGLGG